MITRLLAWLLAAFALLAAALAVNTWRQPSRQTAVERLVAAVRVRQADTARFHGVDERIAIANYAEMVRFYHLFIQEAAR